MSYEIIKRITFNEKSKDVSICGESSNCTPKLYNSTFHPVKAGDAVAYERFKRYFAESLFDGGAEFQPSCASKAKRAYDMTCSQLSVAIDPRSIHPLYWATIRMFPHKSRWDADTGKFVHEPADARERYERFRDEWCALFVENLNAMLLS